jgi:medium-chain acyl-[acyl-carrier-protein] hydrolase
MEDINKNKLSEGGLIISMPFKVTSAHTDMHARLRIGSMVNLLIQSAINAVDKFEIGYDALRQQKLFWVLSRLTVEVYKSLTWYQTGEVETWPKDIQKILYIRDFVVRDQGQEIVAKATSGWLGIDLETKRTRTIESVQSSIFTKLKDKNALNINPEKLFPVKEGEVSEIRTSYFDIDLNGHVTATRYIDWMMDTFSIEFHQNNYPRIVSINYLNETRPNETVYLSKKPINGKTFIFEGLNKSRNTFAFRGKIEF